MCLFKLFNDLHEHGAGVASAVGYMKIELSAPYIKLSQLEPNWDFLLDFRSGALAWELCVENFGLAI